MRFLSNVKNELEQVERTSWVIRSTFCIDI